MLERNRAMIEMGSGASAMAKVLRNNEKLTNSVIHRSSFVSQIGQRTTVAQLAAGPRFSSMIGTAALPRADWSRVLDDLRVVIGAELHERAVADFEIAADLAAEARDDDTWWVARLPLGAQLFLMLMALQVLDKAGEFLGDLTGEDVPQVYRTGTEALLFLAFALYAFIEARAELTEDEKAED